MAGIQMAVIHLGRGFRRDVCVQLQLPSWQ